MGTPEVPMFRTASFRVLLMLLCLPFLASCAFVDREAELKYSAPPREGDAPVQEGAVRVRVALREILDRRKETAEIGEVRNGFGMRTAAVKSKGDPVAWLREAVAAELERAGFAVVDPAQADDLAVEVHLQTMHCTATGSYEGTVCIAAKALRASGSLVDGVYNGTGSAGVNWSATDESFAETLDLALQDALIQFTQEMRKSTGGGVAAPKQ